ncbi:MAG: zinc ribbon domain-containing protein [Thermodesulfobacterium sp.]|nr:zinc ribbon domain-containing protein [Thermodesulfobacterium sp.]
MPIYEYKCLNCGKLFERFVLKAREEKKVKCPHCSSQNIKKVLSGFHSGKSSSFNGPSCGGRGFGFT